MRTSKRLLLLSITTSILEEYGNNSDIDDPSELIQISESEAED